jgi:hypothetical protein
MDHDRPYDNNECRYVAQEKARGRIIHIEAIQKNSAFLGKPASGGDKGKPCKEDPGFGVSPGAEYRIESDY